jgi:hypothetical protein
MANFMTFPMTAKTQVSGNDIVIGTDRSGAVLAADSLIVAMKEPEQRA